MFTILAILDDFFSNAHIKVPLSITEFISNNFNAVSVSTKPSFTYISFNSPDISKPETLRFLNSEIKNHFTHDIL